MHTLGSFCWRECGTRDAAAARDFYRELFGWEATEQAMPGAGGSYTVLSREGRDVAGLYELSGPRFEGVPPHWATYISHDDVDAAVDKARAFGAEVLGGPFDVPNVGRIAVLKDPQGAVFHLLQGTEGECAHSVDDAPGSFCWSELVTTDTEGAGRFYGDLLGWTTVSEDLPPHTAYTSFLRGKRHVGGMLAMEGPAWQGVPPHWMNYVSVEDAGATVERARQLGGNVVVPPTDVPRVGRFATLQDPTGATFSVLQPVPREV